MSTNVDTKWSEGSVRQLTRIPDKQQAARVAAKVVNTSCQVATIETGRNRYPSPKTLCSPGGVFSFQSRETLRATLDAYGDGKIELGKVPAKTRDNYILYAPYVNAQNENNGSHPYTKSMLAQFLGWTQRERKTPSFAFETAFRALELLGKAEHGGDRSKLITINLKCIFR